MTTPDPRHPAVVIVAANASTVFGGESILPWHYFRLLRARGVDVHLVTNARNRADLLAQPEYDAARIHLVQDSATASLVYRIGTRIPRPLQPFSSYLLVGAINDIALRRRVRALLADWDQGPIVVHEPIPVSPKQPSLMTRLGRPLLVGPLNGGMKYPPAFRPTVPRGERRLRALLRLLGHVSSWFLPARAHASLILVANERTRRALPRRWRAVPTRSMVENGVDLSTFALADPQVRNSRRRTFVFVGRLDEDKRVDVVIRALGQLPPEYAVEVIGDGVEAPRLQRLAAELGVSDRVHFLGMKTQRECAALLGSCTAMVLPSIYESGGAVVLEAMATGIPVIATGWGGPAQYIDSGRTGILVEPSGLESLVSGFAEAMTRLGEDPDLTAEIGLAGRRLVEREYDWVRKIDQIQDVYREVASR